MAEEQLALIDYGQIAGLAERQGFTCRCVERTQSTNDDVFSWYREQGTRVVVVAESQTAGRGRQGRPWCSPYARNIYCSIGLSLQLTPRQLGLLSLFTGITLCETLHRLAYRSVRLKWPNDLLLDHEKLGGILVETKPLAGGERLVVIGFGINVLMSREELAVIDQPSTSLAQAASGAPDRSMILAHLLNCLLPALNDYRSKPLTDIVTRFAALDAYAGELIEVHTNNAQIAGENAGIDDQGRLCIETATGRQSFAAGEVSLRSSLG